MRCSGHFYANLNREPEASMQGGSEMHALTADVLLAQSFGQVLEQEWHGRASRSQFKLANSQPWFDVSSPGLYAFWHKVRIKRPKMDNVLVISRNGREVLVIARINHRHNGAVWVFHHFDEQGGERVNSIAG